MRYLLFIGLCMVTIHLSAQSLGGPKTEAIWLDQTRTDHARVDDLIHQINLLWEKGQWSNSIELIEKIPEFEIGKSSKEYRAFYLLAKAASYDWEWDMRMDSLMKGTSLAEQADYIFGRSIGYVYLGIYHERQSNDSLALDYYIRSIEVSGDPREYHLLMNKAWAETKAAMNLILRGKIEQAAYYEQEAEKTYLKIKNNPAAYYFFYYELGATYSSIKNYDKALEYFKRALPFMPEENPFVYNQIAYIYESQGEWEQALEYYEFSRKKYKIINRRSSEFLALSDMGRMNVKVGQLDKAHAIANELMLDAKKDQPVIARMRVYTLLGDIANAEGKGKEALEHFKTAKMLIEQDGTADKWWESINELTLGTTYLKEMNFSKAIEHCLECQDYFEEENDPVELFIIYETLYKAYKASGKKSLAIENLEKMMELKKDEDPIETAKQLQKFEFEKQLISDSLQQMEKFLMAELEHETELRKSNRSKFFAFGGGGLVLLISIGLWSRLRHMRKTKAILEEKNKIIEEEKERAKSSEETKQRFLANMSHEIRTPMNAIKGMTDILLRREPLESQLQYLTAIKESSTSLMVVINDILDFSKIEAGKINLEKIPFVIADVVRNVEVIMKLRADEVGLQLLTEIHKDLPTSVIGDPTRLHQILLNLVGNAVKFTEKGVVSIAVSLDPDSPKELPRIKFTVSDTGVGIGKDRLERIFASFEQAYSDTTRKFGGTGLGLSISKMLVELQNGEISVESQKGKGTQFHVILPYKISKFPIIEKSISSSVDSKEHSKKELSILLVEDNEFNAIVAQEELEDALKQVRINVAVNGAIAVEMTKMGTYDLILMDVQMPVMNGHEATQKIRALGTKQADIPIIAMTANVLKDEVEHCLEIGMNDFIGKPFDIDQLVSKIDALVYQK